MPVSSSMLFALCCITAYSRSNDLKTRIISRAHCEQCSHRARVMVRDNKLQAATIQERKLLSAQGAANTPLGSAFGHQQAPKQCAIRIVQVPVGTQMNEEPTVQWTQYKA